MNNDELKKKIVDIIQMKLQECPFQPLGITYGEAAEYVADALIAAGIGDVKESENKATAAELVAQAAASTAIKKIAEWKHRAEVAEKALEHAVNVYIAHTETSSKKKWRYKYFLREAEKELAEERKSD